LESSASYLAVSDMVLELMNERHVNYAYVNVSFMNILIADKGLPETM